MELLGLAVVILTIALVWIIQAQKNTRIETQRNERIRNSYKVDGQIIAVERQTQHERMRAKKRRIRLKVQYMNPETENLETVVHLISRFTPNMHSHIAGAVGIVSVGSKGFSQLAARHKQMMAYREELLAEGKSEAEVKGILEQVALRMATSTPGGLGDQVDSDGFLIVPAPINVDLYFDKEDTTQEFILAFRPEEETARFASIDNFK